MGRCLAWWVLWFCCAGAQAAGESRFRIAEDGAVVIDTQARLVWSRCAEGMTWQRGTCTGDPSLYTYNQAAARARARATQDGAAWRLPTMTELKALAERLRAERPGASTLFPQAPDGWYWTSSVRVDTGRVNQYDYANAQRGLTENNVNRIGYLHGWVVDVEVVRTRNDMPRRESAAARLVRRLDD
jgi:hypothetical protein